MLEAKSISNSKAIAYSKHMWIKVTYLSNICCVRDKIFESQGFLKQNVSNSERLKNLELKLQLKLANIQSQRQIQSEYISTASETICSKTEIYRNYVGISQIGGDL